MPTVVSSAERRVTAVQSTAHWTAVIATVAVSVCLIIAMAALAIVVAHDGNTAEVSGAMADMVNIGGGLAIVLGAVVGGPQIVSALMSRFLGASQPAAAPPLPAAPSDPTTPGSAA